MARPPIIGIVGGVGSGKSVVASIFRDEGCVVSDSDALAHDALRDPNVRDELVSWWGPRVLDTKGEINRSTVALIVFADAAQRTRLEALVHPWIATKREQSFDAAPSGTKALVIDAPLLLEAGLGASCDAIVFVDAPRALRAKRAAAARGWDESEFARREAAQWDVDRKRAASQHVIRNDNDVESLRGQVRAVIAATSRATGG